MKTLKISEETARELYPTADEKLKKILEESFGLEFFTPKNIMDRIKTMQDVYNELKLDAFCHERLLTESGLSKDEKAYKRLKLIVKALNEGWVPDWDDSNQRKYFPWFNFGSGSGFSSFAYDSWIADSGVGSRLCFRSAELAEYAGKQFTSIYKEFMVI
jgi:hypothetical protein